MELNSPAFDYGKEIPRRYTCQGANINPPLVIRNVPQGAKSLALIMDDPDVPKSLRPDGMYVHWVVFNIDPKTLEIKEEASKIGTLGLNTADKNEYTGPCPPDRQHRYFFKLYALDNILDLASDTRKEELLQAMEGHILDEVDLMGVYEKS